MFHNTIHPFNKYSLREKTLIKHPLSQNQPIEVHYWTYIRPITKYMDGYSHPAQKIFKKTVFK